MTTHSSILAWKIPWTEEPGELQSNGSQRVRHDRVTKHKWSGDVTWYMAGYTFITVMERAILRERRGEK